jgi:ParB-like chromosome segregation protein Spo0J
MTQRKPTPNILAGPVNVLDDVLSGKAAGWPKEVDYPVERVIVGKRLRPVRDVTDLAESMDQIGLLNRITLLPDGTLVAGAHRLAAAKHLGWATIPARIAELNEIDSELAEIDENLRRTELTVLEQAEHLLRREELLAAKGVRAKAGDNQHSETTTTATIAGSMGISERSAQQRLQIARGLSQEARDALRGTELAESTTKLVELSRQPQQYQVAIVRKMVDDGYMTVDAAASTVIPRKPEPDPALVAEGERKERERLAYMAENGRRNEEHWAKMREELASAATGSRQQGAELARCSVCNRPLSDPASAIAGVGPCCAAKRTTAAGSGEPTISLDELEVEDSVAVRMDTDGKPLMDWDEEDWAAYERKLKERQIVQAAPAAESVRSVPQWWTVDPRTPKPKDEVDAFRLAADAMGSAVKLLGLARQYLNDYHDDMQAGIDVIATEIQDLVMDLR